MLLAPSLDVEVAVERLLKLQLKRVLKLQLRPTVKGRKRDAGLGGMRRCRLVGTSVVQRPRRGGSGWWRCRSPGPLGPHVAGLGADVACAVRPSWPNTCSLTLSPRPPYMTSLDAYHLI